MNPYLDWFLTILYYTSVPFIALFRLLLIILQPLWYILYVVSLPFIYLGHFATAVVTYPLRFLGTLETLWIYLSTAALVGLFSGLFLYFSAAFLSNLLRLKPTGPENPPARRTVADYRAERRKKKTRSPYPMPDYGVSEYINTSIHSWPPAVPPGATSFVGGTGLLPTKGPFSGSQTILEEEDSEDYSG